MYIVHNLTNKTVILSDLRVEIGPRKVIDLERVAERITIERSRDLRQALNTRKLALTRHSVIKAPAKKTSEVQVVERVVNESSSLDENRIAEIVRKAVADEMKQKQDDTVQKAMATTMGGLVSQIRDQINSIQIPQQQDKQEPLPIDPAKFAEISQQSIERISEGIETSGGKQKRINIINKTDISNLASELE